MKMLGYRTGTFIEGVVTTKVGWYCIWPESTKWFKIYDTFGWTRKFRTMGIQND